tara:strand:+ start:405 stop:1328 length:924 start_codon:yes stop_codon:yes gene_type:complete
MDYLLISSYQIRHSARVFLWLIFCIFSVQTQAAIVAIDEDVVIDYYKFIGQRNPLHIKSYTGPHSRRDVIELLLLLQILDAGGFKEKVELLKQNSYRRTLSMIRTGDALAYGTPAWSGDVSNNHESYWVSKEMIRSNEFLVGAYTSEDNLLALSANAKNFSALSAVSSKQWRVDWNILQSLRVKALHNATSWPRMIKMVGAQRVDFTLSPFYPSPSMKITRDDITLVPIPNIRISMGESRLWVVSRKHPDSEAMQLAITKGMAKFRQQGTIVRAYTESGFFDPRVKNWKVLNPDTVAQLSSNASNGE